MISILRSNENMTRQIISTIHVPKPAGPYSQAVRAGNLVFVAGQLPIDRMGNLVGIGDVRLQTDAVLANISAILEEAGSSMDEVVKTTVFLTDLDDFDGMNEVYARHFTSPYPARSTIEIGRLPKGMRLEIECVATLG